VIYLDTSVALAHLFAEDRRAPARIWREPLVSSRLLEYELWNRVQAMRSGASHGDAVREVLGRVSLMELSPHVLQRALDPFPVAVRTLDALHLATAAYLAANRQPLALATFDGRMREAARALGLKLAF